MGNGTSSSAPTLSAIFGSDLSSAAAKRASAHKVVIVMPYMGYARQDRKAKPREPISGRFVAGWYRDTFAPLGPCLVTADEKDGKPYAWALGHQGAYEVRLPAGGYSLYATGRSYARSDPVAVTVTAGGTEGEYGFHN